MKEGKILTIEQMQSFKNEGFLIVPGFYGPEDMKEIIAWVSEVQSKPEIPGNQWMYFEESLKEPGKRLLNRVEKFASFHDGFDKLFRGKLADVTSDLLGEPTILFKEKINFKQSGGGGFEPHQDHQAGWDAYVNFFISVMVCIDEATVDNGCIEIAPGRHKEGLIGEEWIPLAGETLENLGFQHFPTNPGDIVFFDSFAPHRSTPNLSDKPRRLIFATYNGTSEGDHREHYYADKHKSYPPDCDREPDKQYVYRV